MVSPEITTLPVACTSQPSNYRALPSCTNHPLHPSCTNHPSTPFHTPLHPVPGYLPSLSTFSREVVGPFLLSAADQPAVCAVKMGHDTPLPQPKAKPGAAQAEAGVAAAAQEEVAKAAAAAAK